MKIKELYRRYKRRWDWFWTSPCFKEIFKAMEIDPKSLEEKEKEKT